MTESTRVGPIAPLMACAGACGILAQTVIVRELMVGAYGTEPALAAGLVAWLAFLPLGALVGGLAMRLRRSPLRVLTAAAIAYGCLLPTQTVLAGLGRCVLGIEPGRFPSLPQMLLAAAIAAGPVSFMVGLMFPAACKLEASRASRPDRAGAGARAIRWVYVADALGACAAGAAMSFVLAGRVVATDIALLAGCGWLLVAGLWLLPVKVKAGAACIALGLTLGLGDVAFGRSLRAWTLRMRWRTFGRFDLAASRESRYQHIDLATRHGLTLVAQNGLRSAVFPDEVNARRDAAILLTQHPDPRRILVVGGGLAGLCQSILSAGPFRVDYVEMDPALISLYMENLPSHMLSPLRTDRFAAYACDGRRFIQRVAKSPDELVKSFVPAMGTGPPRAPAAPYDLVLLNLGDPASASSARFFTVEFFQEARRSLARGGVLAVWGITGSEDYLHGSVLDYTACLYATLGRVFPRVVVRPGTEFRFFAGAGSTSDPAVLAARFKALDLAPRDLDQAQVQYLFETEHFPPERVAYVTSGLREGARSVSANTDDRPVLYVHFLRLQQHYTSAGRPSGRGLFDRALALRPWWFAAACALASLFVTVAGMLSGARGRSAWSCGFSVVTTGMFGMSCTVLIIYAFQTSFGYVYRDVGAIVGLFMLGLAGGAHQAGRLAEGRDARRILLLLEAGQVVAALLLPWLLGLLSVSPWLFIALAVPAGALTGGVFPVAAHMELLAGRDTGRAAGLLDACDHTGALAGAALAGLVLVPVIGLSATALLIACAKVASLLALTATGHLTRLSAGSYDG